MYKRLVTVGLEIETENIIFSKELTSKIVDCGFKLISDASVEGTVPVIGGTKIFSDKNEFLSLGYRNTGGEIISTPIDTSQDDWEDNIYKLMPLLARESFIKPSYRCSFHVHVNIDTYTIEELLSIMKWGALLESIMFRIGSFGGIHRGVFNKFNYCRPITNKGPQVIKTPFGFSQVMVLDDLLKSKTTREFMIKYGDTYNNNDFKYHPVRYSWLNLFKLFCKEKTLEFRVFNQTLNPFDIEAMVTLCLCIANTMLTSPPEDISSFSSGNINSIFNPLSESRDILRMILGMFPGKPNIKNRIMWLFDNSEYPKIDDEFVYSHMLQKRDFTLYKNTEYVPNQVNPDDVTQCIYRDKHNFNYSDGFRDLIFPIRNE